MSPNVVGVRRDGLFLVERLPSMDTRQMPIDEELLRKARASLQNVDDAETALVSARRRSQADIRSLHAGGASLREIASALSLSHQRVHQLVTALPSAPVPSLGCAFCGATQAERRKIVMGPKGSGICERCTDHASALLEAWESLPTEEHRRLDPALTVVTDAKCHFCSKKAPRHVPAQVVSLSGSAVCSQCLVLAHEICTDDLPAAE
jgi:hypothetical protein